MCAALVRRARTQLSLKIETELNNCRHNCAHLLLLRDFLHDSSLRASIEYIYLLQLTRHTDIDHSETVASTGYCSAFPISVGVSVYLANEDGNPWQWAGELDAT